METWRNLKRYPKSPCHIICVPPSMMLPSGGFHLDQGYSFLKGGVTCIGTDFTARPCWVLPCIPVTSQEARGGGETTRTLRRDQNTPPFKALPAFCHTFKRFPSSGHSKFCNGVAWNPLGSRRHWKVTSADLGKLALAPADRCSVTILPDSSQGKYVQNNGEDFCSFQKS